MEVSSRGLQAEATIVDGGGMLHAKIYWPTDGTVNDLIRSMGLREKYSRIFYSVFGL